MDKRAKRVSKNVIAALLIFAAAICAMFPIIGAKASAETSADNTTERIAVLKDYDNCLTEAEKSELLERLGLAAVSADCRIGIVITSDLNGMTDKEYADSFSDEYFGAGSDAVVLLLLNSYDKPEYAAYKDWISTSGKMRAMLQNHIEAIFDRIYEKMGQPQGDKYAYNESTGTYGGYDFASACEEFTDSITLYCGKLVPDDDVDPGFSGGGTVSVVSADGFVSWLMGYFNALLRMLGGLALG